jgi:transposase-like protein
MPKTESQSSSTYLKRRRWTAEEAKQALTALDQSGLSPGAFAAREGLSPQRLWRWRRQLGTPAAATFEEIVRRDAGSILEGEATAPAPLGADRFEIVLVSGRVVRVPALFDATALRQLLAIVDEVRAC